LTLVLAHFISGSNSNGEIAVEIVNHMRITCLLLLVAVTSCSGCAGLIARSGTDPTALNTREEVHAKFGEPVASGAVKDSDGTTYEDYVVHQKIAANTNFRTPPEFLGGRTSLESDYENFLLFTLGTCELVLIPEQLILTTVRCVGGERIRIKYDREGRLIEVHRNSNCDYFQSKDGVWPYTDPISNSHKTESK
jgi:YD repeat-containing protein